MILTYIAHPKFVPFLISALFAYTSLRYMFAREWWYSVYWFAAGLINLSVIMMGPK